MSTFFIDSVRPDFRRLPTLAIFLLSLSGCTNTVLMNSCEQWEYRGSYEFDIDYYVSTVTEGCGGKCGCLNDAWSIACESGSENSCFSRCAGEWDLVCSDWAEFPATVNFITDEVHAVRRSTPDPFTLTPQDGVAPGLLVMSNSITVSGINFPAIISISGGEYSVNGDAFTSAPSTVKNGDTVTVRRMSADSYSTTTDAILTIGGVRGTFSITTAPESSSSETSSP